MTVPNHPYDPAMGHEADDVYFDVNGCLTERVVVGSQELIVHYDDVPESDITTVGGLRCTTALRTVIDIAPEMSAREFERIVRDCLERKLFSVAAALARIADPDMLTRPGAKLLGQTLPTEE
jgi:hypothetical protein